MTSSLPFIDPAVISHENMLNRRWPRNLTARVQGLQRVIAEVLMRSDSTTGEADIDLAKLEVPPTLRIDIMRDLAAYNYFFPLAPARQAPRGRAKVFSYGRAGVLAPLIGWAHWSQGAPFSKVRTMVSPPILGLLPHLKQEMEAGDLFNRLRIPGKYGPRLYSFLATREFPVEASVDELREALLGSKKGKTSMHKRTADFLKYGVLASVKILNRYSDLRIEMEHIVGIAKKHKVIDGVRFELLDIVGPEKKAKGPAAT